MSAAQALCCSQCCLPFGTATDAPVAVASAVVPMAHPVGVAAATSGSQPPPAPPLDVTPPLRFGLIAEPVAASSWRPPTTADVVPVAAGDDGGRLLDRRAAVLVAAAIGLGGALQLVALALAHSSSIEPATLIRYDLLLTIALYCAVAVMIVSQLTPSISLRWGDGALGNRVGIGLGLGVGLSLLLLAAYSSATGHLAPDPRIVLLMSEGDPTHIVVTVLLTCAAAPLVEEVLFRGLLLESLRPRGRQVAVLVSAVAFAAWHFMPASLVYYSALGAALGGLYLARGLACSIAAHVGFNAVLTIAAIIVVLGPSHMFTVNNVQLTTPSGWSQATPQLAMSPDGVLALVGPSDSQLDVVAGPVTGPLSVDDIASRIRQSAVPLNGEFTIDTAGARVISLPIGEAVETSLTVEGRSGTLVLFDPAGQIYEVLFLDAGSATATRDFQQVLESLRVT
jgi:membrane protease YdiL (CAAX protease family)